MLADASGIAALPNASLPPAGLGERWLTRVGTALDSTILQAMQLVVDSLLIPPAENLPAMRSSAEALLDESLQRDPRRFFDFDDADTRPVEARSRVLRALPGGAVLARELEIAYRPRGADAAPETHAVPVEHWIHGPREPVGSVVLLHGFTMGRPRFDAFVLLAAHWFRLGLDVALVTLPHHGVRTPPDARFSGEHFAVPDVARLAEAVRQAVYEIRGVTLWLREQAEAPVGLMGLSLGGYLTALSAGLYDDLDFAVPMVPPVCIGDMAWRFFQRSRQRRGGVQPSFSHEELRAAFRAHSPLAHPHRVERARLLIVAGRGDRIVPPEHPAALWRHWDEPAIHWYGGGHVSPFGRQGIVDAVARHLRRLGVL